MRAPRERACPSSSSSTAPPPSLSTKPSRSLSHGRLASFGASLRVESAFAWPKLPSPLRVVAIPVLDGAHAEPDRVRRGGAGGHHAEIRALQAVADREVPRDHVDDRRGDEEWGDLAWTLRLEEFVELFLDGPESADAGAAHRAAAGRVGLAEIDAGIGDGL